MKIEEIAKIEDANKDGIILLMKGLNGHQIPESLEYSLLQYRITILVNE